jgi:Double-GTPase 2
MEAPKPNCKQPTCPVTKDGKCLEGLALDKCPHFYWDSGADQPVISKPPNTSNTNAIKLFSGLELKVNEISLITYKAPTSIVIIIGDSESGKTTLISTIFDLLNIGPFANFYFSGSITQIGFEQRCHLSRMSSNLNIPDTQKTTSMEFSFLHLALKRDTELDLPANNILLADISGERFKMARDNSEEMRRLDLIEKAQHLVYVIDGKKLSELGTRVGVIYSTELFIQRAIDTGVFNASTELKIIISKWDFLKDNSTFNFKEMIEEVFMHKFSKRIGKLSFQTVAARPENHSADMILGHGLDVLLNEWVEISNSTLDKNSIDDISVGNKGQRRFETFQS